MKKPTGKKSKVNLLSDNKQYVKRARNALPILVRQAKANNTIYYSDLAEELGMPNPRNLNYVLGAIGNVLEELSKIKKEKIPFINCLVINKLNQLPGEGIGWFIDKNRFEKLSINQKREIIKRVLIDIYSYPDWDWVLKQLNLKSINADYSKRIKSLKIGNRKGKGESSQHKEFKIYIAKHPEIFSINSKKEGQTEYILPSTDTIDVLFEYRNKILGVEVKSKISDSNDILRGLFQCVKYQALIEAEQIVNNLIPDCRVVLALERAFPIELIEIKNLLGIEVIDELR